MPPRKKAASATSSAPPAPPLSGAKIVLCGTFPGATHIMLKQHIAKLGAEPLTKVTPDASHLVATLDSYNKPSLKVKAALGQGISILDVQWLLDCVSDSTKIPEASYLLSTKQATPTATSLALTKIATGKMKRPAPSPDTDDFGPKSPQPMPKKAKREITARKAKIQSLAIPVDESCPLSSVAVVYVDARGVIWDASLNQTNSVQNNNKFYRIQVGALPYLYQYGFQLSRPRF